MVDWTIDAVADHAFSSLSLTDSWARARLRAELRPDAAVVILDTTGYPAGLMTGSTAYTLNTRGKLLTDLVAQWEPVTITRPGTPLTVLWDGMLLPDGQNWHLVWNEGAVIGVASPEQLLAALDQGLQVPPDDLPGDVRAWLLAFARLHLATTYTYSGLPGDPLVAADRRCFYCPGDGTPHHLTPEQVVRNPPDVRAYCRLHPVMPLAVENPCRGGDDD